MHEQQISPDSHDRGSGKRDRTRGELVNLHGGSARGRRHLLLARELQQMVIGRPLLGIGKDFTGIDDLPEFQRSIRVAGPDVWVGAFDGSAECGPQTVSVILWESPEQIVKRRHLALAAGFLVFVRSSRREFAVEHAYKLNFTTPG